MSTFKVDTLQSTTGGVTTLTKQSAAKAWALDETLYSNSNFVADSFNIASTSDQGTGLLHLNFTNSFSNTGFASVAGSAGYSANDTVNTKFSQSTSSKDDLLMQDTAGPTFTDQSITYIAMGDLA
jgi:hypothetical protein